MGHYGIIVIAGILLVIVFVGWSVFSRAESGGTEDQDETIRPESRERPKRPRSVAG